MPPSASGKSLSVISQYYWADFDDLGMDIMVFRGAELIAEVSKSIGGQGHIIQRKVNAILLKFALFLFSELFYFFPCSHICSNKSLFIVLKT